MDKDFFIFIFTISIQTNYEGSSTTSGPLLEARNSASLTGGGPALQLYRGNRDSKISVRRRDSFSPSMPTTNISRRKRTICGQASHAGPARASKKL